MPELDPAPDFTAVLDHRLLPAAPAPLAVAVSGGGDSLALLHLTSSWANANGRQILALTVDHGLHPQSAQWTASAGRAARALGAEWRALTWSGDRPQSGVPEKARTARHRLLANAARDAGAQVILMAHTADDAAESDWMRARTTPGLGRLRAWAPSPAWPDGRGVFILRPLLTARRSALRHYLRGRLQTWLEDPANSDLRFARARARQSLALAPAIESRSAAIYDEQALAAAAVFIEKVEDGRLILPRDVLCGLNGATLRHLLSIALICASGRSSPPRGERLDRLAARLQREDAFVASLAGACVDAAPHAVVLCRQMGDGFREGLQPLRLARHEPGVWDGRFEIQGPLGGVVTPLMGTASRLTPFDRAVVARSPARVRPSLPVIAVEGRFSTPSPFGAGPGSASALVGARFDAACGLILHERDISRIGMAQTRQSSYVDGLALA